MAQMQPPAPITLRSFRSAYAELDYLCRKLRYWLYVRKMHAHAERFLRRLERVLRKVPANDESILRQEGLALLCELKGNLEKAIHHRGQEIALTERLHEDVRKSHYSPTTREAVLRDRGENDLQDRRAILKTLKEEFEVIPHSPRNGKSGKIK